MIPNRKNSQPNWQIFLTLVLIVGMIGWNYNTAAAAGITYYVDNTVVCDDSGPGTMVQPFCTIGKGASVAVAGDTVQVLAGTYAETVNGANSGSAGLPITYSAAPGVTVTGNGLANGGNAFRMSGKSYIVVDGFTITGTADYGIYTWGSNNITITNNHVSYSGSPAAGSTRMGFYINSTSNSTISGNTSDHNSYHGILLTNGSNNNLVTDNIVFGNAQQYQRNANGIRLDGSHNNTILHNSTFGNEDSGFNTYTGSSGNFFIGNLTYGNGDHGMDFSDAPNNTVIGNTVQGNVTVGINFEVGNLALGSGGATVMNNLLVDNGLLQQVGGGTAGGNSGNLRFDANSLTGNTLDYNLYYLSSGTVQIRWGTTSYTTLADFQSAVAGQEIHGLEADPYFAAPAPVAQRPPAAPYNVAVNTGNYHLTSGSPAIDSANSDAPSEPLLDLDGNSRIDDPFTPDSGAGTRTYDDRGAYEFQPIAMPVTITTPAVNAGAGTTITDVGTVPWENPQNITADDTSYATAALNNATSNYLEGTNFGFAIPADATINGIEVTIGRFEDDREKRQDVRDNVVSLIKGGVITGTNYSTGKEWPTGSPVAATYGSTSNLWGTTWTPADINASNFGVAFSVTSSNNRTASVDYMQISVTYSVLSLFANMTIDSNNVKNPDNGWIPDNLYAFFDADTDTADYGFPRLSIPSDATITGIEVIIDGKQGNIGSRNLTAALWNPSTSVFTDTKTANLQGNKDSSQPLGGQTDTWGATWTPADFTTGNFKIRVGATSDTGRAALNAISIRVYYSTP